MPVGTLTPAGNEPALAFRGLSRARKGEQRCSGPTTVPAPPETPPRTRASQSHPVTVPLPQDTATKASIALVLARLANRLARAAMCHLQARPAAILAASGVAPVSIGLNHRHGSRPCHSALAHPGKPGNGSDGLRHLAVAGRWIRPVAVERMRSEREHVLLLSDGAASLLREAAELDGGTEFVFAGIRPNGGLAQEITE